MLNIKPQVFDPKSLEKKAINGDGLAAYLLGRGYFSEEFGLPQDDVKARKWYQYGAEQLNDCHCLYGLGICYDDGVGGVERNHDQATVLFEKAYPEILSKAKNQEPYALFILGAYYFYGFANVIPSQKKAFEVIYEAALQGHLAAIYDIGTFYYKGTGCNKDRKLSKQYLELATKAQLPRAKQKLKEWKFENEFVKERRR